ncbi:MAG: dihydrofolate reductase [Bacteroidetes bacterium]|nr:MAG: dihydrofolate reductase [Bacteroidota bacterium]
MPPLITAIYAVSENGVIGKDNDLPWSLPADLHHFKALTLGKPIIMGRRSFESLGKPLPKRRNIVVTRNPDFTFPGVEVVHSLEEGLARCQDEAEICITGGAGLYRESIEKGYVTRIYETLVHAEVDGDTFFSLPEPEAWEIAEVEAHQADDRHEHAYTFRTLVRKDSLQK